MFRACDSKHFEGLERVVLNSLMGCLGLGPVFKQFERLERVLLIILNV